MLAMIRELAYSFRVLRRSPLFTTAAVLSLALGIGANSAIFSLLNQVVLRALPVEDPERLVLLHTDYSGPGSSSSDNSEAVFSYPMYRDLRDRDTAFSAVIARMGTQPTVGWRGNTESAAAELVSGNFFRALGVGAAIGRVLVPEDDDAPGGHPVVVISHSYWSSHFANDPGILNQTVTVNGHPMTVVGVADARFNGIVVHLWLKYEPASIPGFQPRPQLRERPLHPTAVVDIDVLVRHCVRMRYVAGVLHRRELVFQALAPVAHDDHALARVSARPPEEVVLVAADG
jgi:hypothetical protein